MQMADAACLEDFRKSKARGKRGQFYGKAMGNSLDEPTNWSGSGVSGNQ